jgi:hypothetical protein
MDHLTNWIEIPVNDLPRAQAFYEALLGVALAPFDLAGFRYALFPAKDRHNTGALVQGPGRAPSPGGPLVYLDATGRMDELLGRVTAAGGTILMPRTFVSPEAGDVAIFEDPEGNRVGLQAAVDAPAAAEPVTDELMQRLLGGAEKRHTFLVRRGPAYDDPASLPLQWEHARNMFTLLRAGKLRSVTALVDGRDVLGVGVLAVATREEAEQILRDDPGVRGGRLSLELLTGVSFEAGDLGA